MTLDMTFEAREKIIRHEEYEAGETAGKAEGEAKLAQLISKLISLGRDDDVSRAASDKIAREALYKEFGMTE